MWPWIVVGQQELSVPPKRRFEVPWASTASASVGKAASVADSIKTAYSVSRSVGSFLVSRFMGEQVPVPANVLSAQPDAPAGGEAAGLAAAAAASEPPACRWRNVYAVLRNRSLLLYTDEDQTECAEIVLLHQYRVSMFPIHTPDSEMYLRTNPIALIPRASAHGRSLASRRVGGVGATVASTSSLVQSLAAATGIGGPGAAALANPLEQELFLYAPTGSDKEDWFFMLRRASKLPSQADSAALSTGHPSADPTRAYIEAMEKLISNTRAGVDAPANAGAARSSSSKSGSERHRRDRSGKHRSHAVPASPADQASTAWLNALVGRAFVAVHANPYIKDWVIHRLMRRAPHAVQPNSFLGDIVIQDLHVGNSLPVLSNPRLLDISVNGDMNIEVDIDYTGGVRVEAATVANLSVAALDAYMKPITVPIVVAVTIKRFSARVLLKIKPFWETNRVWFGFYRQPELKLELEVEPIISNKLIKIQMVNQVIERRIKQALEESVMLPNMDDLSFWPFEDIIGSFPYGFDSDSDSEFEGDDYDVDGDDGVDALHAGVHESAPLLHPHGASANQAVLAETTAQRESSASAPAAAEASAGSLRQRRPSEPRRVQPGPNNLNLRADSAVLSPVSMASVPAHVPAPSAAMHPLSQSFHSRSGSASQSESSGSVPVPSSANTARPPSLAAPSTPRAPRSPALMLPVAAAAASEVEPTLDHESTPRAGRLGVQHLEPDPAVPSLTVSEPTPETPDVSGDSTSAAPPPPAAQVYLEYLGSAAFSLGAKARQFHLDTAASFVVSSVTTITTPAVSYARQTSTAYKNYIKSTAAMLGLKAIDRLGLTPDHRLNGAEGVESSGIDPASPDMAGQSSGSSTPPGSAARRESSSSMQSLATSGMPPASASSLSESPRSSNNLSRASNSSLSAASAGALAEDPAPPRSVTGLLATGASIAQGPAAHGPSPSPVPLRQPSQPPQQQPLRKKSSRVFSLLGVNITTSAPRPPPIDFEDAASPTSVMTSGSRSIRHKRSRGGLMAGAAGLNSSTSSLAASTSSSAAAAPPSLRHRTSRDSGHLSWASSRDCLQSTSSHADASLDAASEVSGISAAQSMASASSAASASSLHRKRDDRSQAAAVDSSKPMLLSRFGEELRRANLPYSVYTGPDSEAIEESPQEHLLPAAASGRSPSPRAVSPATPPSPKGPKMRRSSTYLSVVGASSAVAAVEALSMRDQVYSVSAMHPHVQQQQQQPPQRKLRHRHSHQPQRLRHDGADWASANGSVDPRTLRHHMSASLQAATTPRAAARGLRSPTSSSSIAGMSSDEGGPTPVQRSPLLHRANSRPF
ncbi:hypothetical protein HK105_205552 [Polyrhizophydium stewartii]|uniref:SMP-LTD domain-containing protein n=1 Tax=Polyrhizophydium stewartii TaxID=2732419 RepID=A0ABR4N648_9FUNG